MKGLATLWTCCLVVACSSNAGTTIVSETAGFDVAEEVAAEVAFPDTAPEVADAVPDFGREETWEVEAELFVEPGGFGYPCQSGDQCLSNYCVLTPDGSVCSVTCDDDCPAGWLCALDKNSAPDAVFVCVLAHVGLCRPCVVNDDCLLGGADAGLDCVALGQAGAFCAAPCLEESDCPAGYACQETVGVAGEPGFRCIRAEGECQCQQWFVDAQAHTECFSENEWGVCPGDRYCLSDGLSPCDAAEPAQEVCNGLDDDCDELVDEGTGGADCLVENEWGTCSGKTKCVGGETECTAPAPEPEACDGLDNNCDGETDEKYPDTDGDGLADCLETDKDGDGVEDVQDNCELTPNSDQADADLDGDGDACDLDDDNDKVADGEDCKPFDSNVYPGAFEACNGVDDDCDNLTDEGWTDTDADGLKDCVDPDDDNDGHDDVEDCLPLDPASFPDAPELCDGQDNNCDGEVDEGFSDLDGDGLSDCLDDDLDGDGVANESDNCPVVANNGQENQDGDSLGDACDDDLDGDGIPNGLDNCPGTFNPPQADTDNDGIGDACEGDKDGDGVADEDDNCLLVPNAGQGDQDSDGQGDACDPDIDGDGDDNAGDCGKLDPEIHHQAVEKCDGLDNNCNGQIDEQFGDFDLDGLKDCVDPDDDNDGAADVDDCAPGDPSVHPAAAEVCNGVDDDCSGQVDDGLGTKVCGQGVCLHTIELCLDGELQFCDPWAGAGVEKCDALDNDCDGTVDEELGAIECGFGNCHHSVPACVDGELNVCDPEEGAVAEVCDGEDNDCDGLVDEALGVTTCGLGQCVHTVPNCLDGEPVQCAPMAGAVDEMCDGKDNDCDGTPDEELGQTTCGLGICTHTIDNCVDGKPQVCNPFEGAGLEECDGLDNDCDGAQDEGLGTSTCGLGACVHTVPNCVEGELTTCDPEEGATEEECDGLDNDCDGLLDEQLGSTTCGLGECEHTVPNCTDGVPVLCDPDQGKLDEVCDGKDNDCDGEVDNGLGTTTCGLGICEHTVDNCADGLLQVCNPLEGQQTESCDQLDNNCNGQVDEEDAADCVGYYLDEDQDGWGVQDTRCLCSPDGFYTALVGNDCKDDNGAIHPEAEEVCGNNVDDDCANGPDDGCILKNCKAILAATPGAATGNYQVDPDGVGGAPPFTVHCHMTFSDGGWTQMTSAYLASLGNESKEYLYVANGAWYRSPATTHTWSWSSYQPVNGTYYYGKSSPQGSFGCTHGEQGYWGIGCSNCGGSCWKCFVHGAGHKDVTNGQTTICQDKPNIFGYGACGQPVQIYVR